MKSENVSTGNEQGIENELDIRELCCTLWRGKVWIAGIAVLFAALALGASYLMKQEWSAQAITDRPTINALGRYYAQQQFLRNLDAGNSMVPSEQPGIAEGAYTEFIMQLAAYDTRRDFWLQSDYYKQRQSGDPRADAVLLDELINDIQFFLRDDKKTPNDGIRLTAETAADANQLLRQYVAFADQRAMMYLNQQLQGSWKVREEALQAQVERQTAVALAVHQRELNALQQALRVAEEQGINRNQAEAPAEELPDSELFLLGRPLLQARIEAMQTTGPRYDLEYDQNRAMLMTLNKGITLDKELQAYRYLRTPEEPVKRDSPRRVFLLIFWGVIGAFIGTGVVLVRRIR